MTSERHRGYIKSSAQFFAEQPVTSFGDFVRAQDAYAAAPKDQHGNIMYSFGQETDAAAVPGLAPIMSLRENRAGQPELTPVEDTSFVLEKLIKGAGGEFRRDQSRITPLDQTAETVVWLVDTARTVLDNRLKAEELGIQQNFHLLRTVRDETGPYTDFAIRRGELCVVYGVAGRVDENEHGKGVLNVEIISKTAYHGKYNVNSKNLKGRKK